MKLIAGRHIVVGYTKHRLPHEQEFAMDRLQANHTSLGQFLDRIRQPEEKASGILGHEFLRWCSNGYPVRLLTTVVGFRTQASPVMLISDCRSMMPMDPQTNIA